MHLPGVSPSRIDLIKKKKKNFSKFIKTDNMYFKAISQCIALCNCFVTANSLYKNPFKIRSSLLVNPYVVFKDKNIYNASIYILNINKSKWVFWIFEKRWGTIPTSLETQFLTKILTLQYENLKAKLKIFSSWFRFMIRINKSIRR